jgi:hypothetical protein
MTKYHWVRTEHGTDRLYDVGILPDGSLIPMATPKPWCARPCLPLTRDDTTVSAVAARANPPPEAEQMF